MLRRMRREEIENGVGIGGEKGKRREAERGGGNEPS